MLQPNKYRELQATHPDLSSFIGDSELYDTHEYLNHKNRLYISDQGVRPARSFKIAGVANQVLEAYDDGADSFTIASAGSAAMALGNTLRRLDRNSTANIFLPRASSSQKIKHIYNEHPDGVIIKNDFDTFDDARLAATQHAAQTGAHLIEPFNSRSMIAGNVAIVRDAVDKLRDREDRNLVLSMAIGGAGLIAAASIVASQQPGIRLVAAQYASNNSLSRSLQAQKVTAIDQPDSLCAGSAVREIGEIPFEILNGAANYHENLLSIETVTEAEIGYELYVDGISRQKIEPAIGQLAYESMTESTGLLGLAAARKTELSDDEVVLAFATGANPEHDKDSSAIRRYLQAKNV